MDTKKDLIIFDLDSTMTDIDVNYTFLIKLLEDKEEQKNILSMNSKMNYTVVFNYFYQKLFSTNKDISIDFIKEKLKQIKLAPGIQHLFSYLNQNKKKFFVCLLSGDNSFIVNEILSNHSLTKIFDIVTCQKANIDKEKNFITVDFSEQKICLDCNPSQCKGKEMENFKNILGKENIRKTIFVCDGGNDLCLGKKLDKGDLLFPRKGKSLYKKLFNEGLKEQIKCEIIGWDNAEIVLEKIKEL